LLEWKTVAEVTLTPALSLEGEGAKAWRAFSSREKELGMGDAATASVRSQP
jgi:hypothetical protein